MKHTAKSFLSILLAIFLLTACTPAPASPETAPALPEGRQLFLDSLNSQLGSAGEILPDGERYAAWFARRQNYRVEPWEDEEVAWCVCFLYWGIAETEDYVTFDFDDPQIRTADVDLLWAYFTDSGQTTAAPQPGDIIFFDTNPADDDPTVNHAGAVWKVEESTIYIIEGNTLRGGNHPTGTVAVLAYDLSDPCILGYGELDWK